MCVIRCVYMFMRFDALGLRVDTLTPFVSGGVFFPVQVYGIKAT